MNKIMARIRKFKRAMQYFRIALRGNEDITLPLLRQAMNDGHWQSVTLEWIGRHYFAGDSVIRTSYKDGTYTLSITEEK